MHARSAALAGLLVAAWASSASAANITIDPTRVTQLPSLHPNGIQLADISYLDCLAPTTFTIPVVLVGGKPHVLQLWVGTKCDAYASRNSTNITCKRIPEAKVPETAGSFGVTFTA